MEKRKNRRVSANIKVKYCWENDPAKKIIEAMIDNISEGGIRLILNPEFLTIGSILDLEIFCPRQSGPIKSKGRVVAIQEVKENKLYDVGVSFIEIKEKDVEYIKRWVDSIDLNRILSIAVKNNASDVHLVAGQPPVMRVYGDLKPIQDVALAPEEIKTMTYNILSEQQREKFEAVMELDISFVCDNGGRFRLNIHQEKGQIGAAFRYLPTDIRSISDLNLPPVLEELACKPNGLILVTGPTGCGKSTTLAAMIDIINQKRKAVIMSLEEPIEYIFKSKKSIIEQREIGIDALSFQNALKHIGRQDIDVIFIGEIRDLNSISVALSAAETGHLVLTTLHTMDASSSINRIVDVFPASQQQQIRMQLAETLKGVVSQVLLPRSDKKGMIVASEVLVCNSAVANIIRKGAIAELRGVIESGFRFGMQSFEQSLENLFTQGYVSRESVLAYTDNPSKFI